MGLDAAIDADEDPERFGAVPPAELRARDDPGVLVEPVMLVGGDRAAARRQPGVESAGTDGEGDLVERLLRGALHVEGRWPERRWRAETATSFPSGARRRSDVAPAGHALLR